MNKNLCSRSQPQAHLLALDRQKASLTRAEHPNLTTTSDTQFLEPMNITLFATQIDDNPFGFGSQKLNRYCLRVIWKRHVDEPDSEGSVTQSKKQVSMNSSSLKLILIETEFQ